jgi:hypothetical protein
MRAIRDGVVVTEHLDDDRYIESTLRQIDREVRTYVESLPLDKRGRDVMREIMPGVGCANRVADLLSRIPGDRDRELARLAVEWAMLAIQAHEHVLVKGVEESLIRDEIKLRAVRQKRGSKMPKLDAWLRDQLRDDPLASNDALWAALRPRMTLPCFVMAMT